MAHRITDDGIVSPFADTDHHGHSYFTQLRRKLRWQLLVTYLIPLVLLSAFFHYQYDRTLRQGTVTHLRSVAENKRNTVSLFLQERVANTKSLLFRFEQLPATPSQPEMERALAKLRNESAAFVDIGLFNPRGRLVAYAGPFPELVGTDYSRQSWFAALGTRSGTHVSDVFLGFRDRPHFIVATRRLVGSSPWTLRTSVDPERFADFVDRAILIKDVEAFIVNRRGQRQTHSRSLVSAELHVPRPSTETRVEEVELGGKRYLSAYAWLPQTDWALVVRIPTSIAYAPLSRARAILAGMAALMLLLLVTLVLRSTRWIVGRLEQADRAKHDLQRQLFNAAKLASVGEMAAGVAHEINNPLAIVYEEAGMMKDALDPEFAGQIAPDMDDFRERLSAIMEATMRGRSITSKLLAFARKHDAAPVPTRINRLLERVLAIKEHEFKVSNVEVLRDFTVPLPRVLLNHNQMEQVLLNLLNNARDAVAGNGGGLITLRTSCRGDRVLIEIEDDGCGMDARQMERIFFPFFTTKGVGKGTGLGLSISYGIIKSLGGSIEVTSEVGQGSTFTIFLPALPADDSTATQRGSDHERSQPVAR